MKKLPTLPEGFSPLPEGYGYVGCGPDLWPIFGKNEPRPKGTFWYSTTIKEWNDNLEVYPLYDDGHYALPIDSDAYRRWFSQFIPWDKLPAEVIYVAMDGDDNQWFGYQTEPEAAHFVIDALVFITAPPWPGRWQDSVIARPTDKEPDMNKTPFTIRPDGSLQYNNHVLDAQTTRRLYQYLTEDCLRLHGHAVTPLSLKIGCQTIPAEHTQAFVDAYGSGEWKKPVEKTYRLGQRFNHHFDGGHILANIQGQVALISLRNGHWWDGPFEVKDPYNIKLSEVVANPDNWKEI